jgi:hypothetical protein
MENIDKLFNNTSSLDIPLDSPLHKPLIKQLKSKYNLTEIINQKYKDDDDIINFYHKYFEEIEKIENIGFQIWKLFGLLWQEEKQNLILNILSMTLMLERDILQIKKSILKLKITKNTNMQFQEDSKYLIKLLEKIKSDNYEFIDINSDYSRIIEKYKNGRHRFMKELEEEYSRFTNTVKNDLLE